MNISAVILDYGCVLSLAPTRDDYEPMRKVIGVEAAAFQQLYWRNRDAYDRNVIDVHSYWQEVGHEAGLSLSAEQIRTVADLDCRMWGRTEPGMIEWPRVLRERGISTGVLSNISRYVGDYYRRTEKWVTYFDYLCFSGELGMAKPDAAIYHHCLEALGAQAAEALFVDDREVNIAAACALGMPAIVFHTTEQLQTELEPYGLAESLAEAKSRVR